MKIPKQLRLSQEAVDKLEQQPNQSQYVEDLILGNSKDIPWFDLRFETEKQADRVIDTVKSMLDKITTVDLGETDKIDTSSMIPTCCTQKTPCRHWSFTGTAWVNPLTGEVKEPMV